MADAEQPYNPGVIEAKWQAWWDSTGANEIDLAAAKNPFYTLMMFPYPSAEGLHVGNVFAFTGADIQGRYWRLRGRDVFEPLGFDAFGIHSENYAMKVGRHPRELIPSNIANFTRQLKMMGLMIDWRRTVDTTSAEYYRWTQWVFLKLHRAGFVYRDTREVNWCPKCMTVIADEQVIDGRCERHGDTAVFKKKMPCWFFAITKFADRLLKNHEWLDWSQTTKTAQVNWIGESRGAEIDFAVKGGGERIRVFTTRPDTLFGATFMVLAPEHPAVDAITSAEQTGAIAKYRNAMRAAEELPASTGTKEKTGVFTGAFAINPATGREIPVWIADYVLMGYGTGAIMAVPGGDHRDFEFATKYGIPVIQTIDPVLSEHDLPHLAGFDGAEVAIKSEDGKARIREAVLAGRCGWTGPGKVVNSANAEVSLDGLDIETAKARMIEWLERRRIGTGRTVYRLRDWCISRQRYWGPPIPVIHLEDGTIVAEAEANLPVALPDVEDFRPLGTGVSPLAQNAEWLNVTLPDGRRGRRDTDVMDNFLDSAWYFLRYVSSRDGERAYDPSLIAKWLPVDVYIGGNEHAVLHLMYTRFICMALHEAGVLRMGARPEMKDPAEPFRKFRAHGLLIRDGSKMSKSKGNVVNPDEYVRELGADTLRMYLMFLGPYLQGGDFRDKDIQGIRRFLNRVYLWYSESTQECLADEALPQSLRVKLHQTIKKVGGDIEALSYNTAIAALMELHNEAKASPAVSTFLCESFAIMLSPFAPHLAEEVWHAFLKHDTTVAGAPWPAFDPALTVTDTIEIPVQVNGKLRDVVVVSREADKAALEAAAMASEKVAAFLDGKPPKKVVVVPGRLVNLIVG